MPDLPRYPKTSEHTGRHPHTGEHTEEGSTPGRTRSVWPVVLIIAVVLLFVLIVVSHLLGFRGIPH